ncbi:hypothetical protein NC653_037773 [Populus alba x Populus x berolinensis]|uniref:Uncharacterized protein n=1 Tax=Populus alba x Populus x berolinensis TaxID=444605 RepID=A0AAD6PSK1_9ROSI|nr:hypothetical protein NC653_037773 [Populus alba x Populus x berolinensis]
MTRQQLKQQHRLALIGLKLHQTWTNSSLLMLLIIILNTEFAIPALPIGQGRFLKGC